MRTTAKLNQTRIFPSSKILITVNRSSAQTTRRLEPKGCNCQVTARRSYWNPMLTYLCKRNDFIKGTELAASPCQQFDRIRLERFAQFSPAASPQTPLVNAALQSSELQTQANECCQIISLVNGHKVSKCHSKKHCFRQNTVLSISDALPQTRFHCNIYKTITCACLQTLSYTIVELRFKSCTFVT